MWIGILWVNKWGERYYWNMGVGAIVWPENLILEIWLATYKFHENSPIDDPEWVFLESADHPKLYSILEDVKGKVSDVIDKARNEFHNPKIKIENLDE